MSAPATLSDTLHEVPPFCETQLDRPVYECSSILYLSIGATDPQFGLFLFVQALFRVRRLHKVLNPKFSTLL